MARRMRDELSLIVVLTLLCNGCATGVPSPPGPARAGPIGGRELLVWAPGQADLAARASLAALGPKLDQHYARRLAEAGATGLMVGIVLEGELVYARGFGVRDIGSRAAVDADTVFRIASLSKSFTAAAVLQLRDEGKVELDGPLARYLPELAGLRGPTADSPAMTLRHLLTHASGLAFDDTWGPVTFGMPGDELLRLVRGGVTFSGAPGERYAYSNLGYALLGQVVERVSGIRFRTYVTERILRPLGMRATVWDAGEVPAQDLAIGYRREKEQLVPEPRPPDQAFDAAGGLYTSMRDYARYVAFQLAAYPPGDAPESGPLRRSSLREMHDGQRWSRSDEAAVARRAPDGSLVLSSASYGFGWQNVTTCAYEGIVQHGGYEPGYWASVHLLPRHGLGLVTFATTAAVGWRALAGSLELLREAGLLAERRLPEDPALVQARAALGDLLTGWDASRAQQLFDRQSLQYDWMRNLPDRLATLSRNHGRCRPEGPMRSDSRSHGRGRLSCDRGGIDLTIYLSPARPPRVQLVRWKADLPPSPALARTGQRLTEAINAAAGPAPAGLFAATVDLLQARKTLMRLRLEHGRCALDRPVTSDGKLTAVYHLRCADAPAQLRFAIDANKGLVTELRGGPPPLADSPCAPL